MENLLGKVDKIEPFDPKVKEEYNQFKYDVTKQAIESLRERIPKRIIYFNTLVNVNAEPGTILDINAELEKIKAYSSELIEIIGNIKLWIQLNVPRIEDGNNFGVGIQEEAIQELARVEESAFNLYDAIVKYYMDRAKLSTKVIKYPNVYDYQEAVRELDEKEWVHIKITIIDMRNNYIMLYDLLCKNWEKVVKPKNEDAHHRMTF